MVRLGLKKNSWAEHFFKSQVKSVLSVDAMHGNSGPLKLLVKLGCAGIICYVAIKLKYTPVNSVNSD